MKYKIGMVINGQITGVQPYGAFVALDEQTQGLIHISECHHGYVEDIQKYLKVGQQVKVMIIDIDEYNQKISLSMRCLESEFWVKDKDKIRTQYQHKKYWTNRHVQEGFKPIKENLKGWTKEALTAIEKNK